MQQRNRPVVGARTAFGTVLERYRRREGLSQEEVARLMEEYGYTPCSQRLYSYFLYNRAIRIYSDFFPTMAKVLNLSRFEQAELVDAWLRLPGSKAEDSKGNES